MKKKTIEIELGPKVCVHLAESEAELLKIASEHHEWVQKNLDTIPKGQHVAGMTVGANKSIDVYIVDDKEERYLRETIVHEAVHATNCILRYRIHGNMSRSLLLIISDRQQIFVPTLESLKIEITGANEEDQADLISTISVSMEEAVNDMRKRNGEENKKVK